MRFGKSSCEGALLRSDLRRYWPVAAVYALIWIVALPLPLSHAVRFGYGAAEPRPYMAQQILERLPVSAVLACLFGAAVSMALAGYLMSSKAVGTLHAMPMTRTGLYLTHFAAGFVLYTAANVVVALLSVLASLEAVPWAALGWWLLMTELMGFFFMALGFFAALLTGWLLLAPAAYGLIQFLALLVTALLRGLGQVLYYGYRVGELPEAVIWLTPAVKLFDVCENAVVYSDNALQVNAIGPAAVATAAIYAAVGAALLALGCLLYKARHSEAAGDAVAYRPLRPVVKYLGALGCGIAGGLLLHAMMDVNMLLCTVVITAIACFSMEMILKKSLRVLRSGWKSAVIACVAAAAVCLTVQMDLTGYQTRVPAAEDVAAVKAYAAAMGEVYDVWMEDEETIRAAQALHRRIVDEHSGAAPSPAAGGAESRSAFVWIEYRLKNGGSIHREYSLILTRNSPLHELYGQLVNSPEMQWHSVMGGLTSKETPALAGAFVRAWGAMEEDSITLDTQQALQLYEAIRADLLAGRNAGDVFDGEEQELAVEIQFFLTDGQEHRFSGYVSGLHSGCTETVKTLVALGVRPESLVWEEPAA